MFPTNKFTNLLLSAPYNFPHSPLNWINCPKDQTICTPRHFSRTWYLKLPCLPHFDLSSLFQITPISFQHGIASACFFLSFFFFNSFLSSYHSIALFCVVECLEEVSILVVCTLPSPIFLCVLYFIS